jgi:hypothetical protein
LDAFAEKLTEIGIRIGHFLNYDCIDNGIDVNSPKTRKSLSLTAYELMFVSEAIEQCLLERRMKPLRAERKALIESLNKTKEHK